MFLRAICRIYGPCLSLPPLLGDPPNVRQPAMSTEAFVDRRGQSPAGNEPLFERRQFANSYDELSPDAAELARAIDGYKVQHRRRFVTFEEMLAVIKSLGYSK